MSKTEVAVDEGLKEGRAGRRSRRAASEPLDIYLREVESHDLLDRAEEREVLARLVETRDAWAQAFLHSEGALAAVWEDLQAWSRSEIAGSALVPGPPRLKPGQIGPDDHLRRIHAVFSRYVAKNPDRPFHYQRRRKTRRLVRALLFVGFRPRPLDRYREEAIRRHGAGLEARIAKAREEFVEVRRPLVERNLRLVLKVAWGFVPGPMTFDELIQEGNIGLLRATESFNRRFSVRFSTYAYLWIRQSVIRALEEKSRMIRLPVHLTHLLRKVAREREEGQPLPEVMRYQGKRYRLPKILANPTVTGGLVSLDSVGHEEDGGLADVIPDRDAPAPEARVHGADARAFIGRTVAKLPTRLRKIVKLRFGIGCKRPHTLGEIGTILGVSSERIRQLQEEALRALREGPDGEVLEDLNTVA
ncbi:MAG: sigma-70 family RNA polymerase sigma factor [Planctomycetes bacterium]|nr:sigma-70 family RNA polymerase sigma factor [Planctomycetota bacterium]